MFEPINAAAVSATEKARLEEAQRRANSRVSLDESKMRALVAEAKRYEEEEEEEGMKPWINGEPEMTKEEREQIIKEEREAHEQRQKDYQCSWHKKVLEQGHAPGVYANDRVSLHVVSHLHSIDGPVFDSSRDRGVPSIITADAGSLVPGLDKGLLTCNEGEKCIFTIQPPGAYGLGGLVDAKGVRIVPGDCTCVYEVEVVKVEEMVEMWQMFPDTKLRHAEEYRERGNTLFRNKYFKIADEEYELALNFLLFQYTKDEQQPFVHEKEHLPLTHTVRLNLMATKLKLGREDEAIEHGDMVLEKEPKHPKVLYRMGQAHAQLGNYEKSQDFFNKAIEASPGDAEAVNACRKELEKLAKREERHNIEQKKTYAKMAKAVEAKPTPSPEPNKWLKSFVEMSWLMRFLISLAISSIWFVMYTSSQQRAD